MLTREEKKKIKDDLRQRNNPALVLLDKEDGEIAKMISKGFDFPWSYGELIPSTCYSKYSEIFESSRKLRELEEQASKDGNEELEEKYSDEARDLLDEISDMGFRIVKKSDGSESKYITLNIVGLDWEYK